MTVPNLLGTLEYTRARCAGLARVCATQSTINATAVKDAANLAAHNARAVHAVLTAACTELRTAVTAWEQAGDADREARAAELATAIHDLLRQVGA